MPTISQIETSQIVPGGNDRTVFGESQLRELAENIEAHGLIQPITIRSIDGTDMYEIVAGERRFRSCADILGWKTIPAIVADLTDEEASAIMLSENVARADIDPIDEANAYASRMTRYGWTVSDCARRAGVSEIRVQFRLKLLRLRLDLQSLVRTGGLPIGYAQILADAHLDTTRQMFALASLRDNTNPSPAWFRRICNQLLSQQSQESLLGDLPILTGEPIEYATRQPITEPPTPATHTPPSFGKTIIDRLESQVSFWEAAARQWDNLGKPFKRQECEAAVKALQFALNPA